MMSKSLCNVILVVHCLLIRVSTELSASPTNPETPTDPASSTYTASQTGNALQTDTATVSGISYGLCSFTTTNKTVTGACKRTSISHCMCFYKMSYINCSLVNLTNIPDDIPTQTEVLLLNHNKLTHVPNEIFVNNRKIRYLDLSYNAITALSNDSFVGLYALETLLLHKNSLHYTPSSIPPVSFEPLHTLYCLHIEQKTKWQTDEDYPTDIFEYLENLETLYMNGLPGRNFSEPFRNLTRLRTVVLSGLNGRCNLTLVTQGNFASLAQLNHLSLIGCNITYIEKGSFEEMGNLTSLNLSFNTDLGFKSLSNISYGLINLEHFESLNLSKIHSTFGECTYLDSEMLEYINETRMQRLVLDSNRLSYIKEDAIDFIPTNLTYISIRDNKMDIALYVVKLLCNFNDLLKNIKTLVISEQNTKRHIGELFSPSLESRFANGTSFLKAPTRKARNDVVGYDEHQLKISYDKCVDNLLSNCGNCLAHSKFGPCPILIGAEECFYPFPFKVPSHLKTVDFGESLYKLGLQDVCLCRPNNLTHLNLKGNMVYSFSGPFFGFESLKTLNLAENYCSNITELSFETMPNLRKLNLSSNFLGTSLSVEKSILPFKRLTHLTHLDLSNNKIRTIPSNIFANLYKIEYLSLSENRLSVLNVNMTGLTKLRYLDLSCNLIETILVDVRNVIAANRHLLRINLSQNKFTCSCQYESYIDWVSLHRQMFEKFNQYYCRFENGDSGYLRDEMVFDRLRRQCTHYTPLILGTSLGIGFVTFIVIFAVLYRYRWRIRYLYYSAKFRYTGYTRIDDSDHFRYDVFVSYADSDRNFVVDIMAPELEQNRGFRLLLHERDFPFGTQVTENIHRAISSSRRTMFVISRGFLTSKWCRYELNIAKIEAIDRDRDVLCVLMKEQVDKSELPIELVEVIANNTYLAVPTEEELFPRFWDTIETSIR